MKIKKEEGVQPKRQKYTVQFKAQVLERAEGDGVAKAVLDLGIAESMLYSWHARSRQTGQSFEDQMLQQAETARLKREGIRLEDDVAFLKKAAAYFAKMCRLVEVSRSGYYRWKQNPPSKRSKANKVLSETIKRVFDDEKERDGSPRITLILQREGISASHNRVAKIMRKTVGVPKRPKKYKATTNSNHSHSLHLIHWSRILKPIAMIKSGYPISPIFGQKKAGCIWPSCLNYTRVGWWAGQWLNACSGAGMRCAYNGFMAAKIAEKHYYPF